MLPKNTARLTASPRERTQAGSAIWAETLRLDSTEIQASPARTQAGRATATTGNRASGRHDAAPGPPCPAPPSGRRRAAPSAAAGAGRRPPHRRRHRSAARRRGRGRRPAGRARPAAGAPRARCRTGRSRPSGRAWRATARCCGRSAGRRGWRRRSARRAGPRRASASRRQSHKARITATKLSALKTNGQARPSAVITSPPSAGPMARAMLMPTPLSATAWASSGLGTRSGVMACQAGAPRAAVVPSRKVNSRSRPGVMAPVATTTARITASTPAQACRPSSRRRRSIRSASAPAGRANMKIGRLVAAWTRATIRGSGASVVISQAAATSCIQVPMFDTTAANQISAKARSRSGAQAEVLARPCRSAPCWKCPPGLIRTGISR